MLGFLQFELQRPLWLLAVLVSVPVVLLLARRTLLRSSPAPRWAAVTVRALVIGCLLLAAAHPFLVQYVPQRRLLVAIDQSASINPAAQRQIDAALATFEAARRQGTCDVHYVAFAGGVTPWPAGLRSDKFLRDATDLSAVVALAGNLPRDKDWEAVVLTDGNETCGDARQAAATCSVPVSIVPLPGLPDDEVYVDDVQGPYWAHPGTEVRVAAQIFSARPAEARIRLRVDAAIIAEHTGQLQPGSNAVVLAGRLPDRMLPGRTPFHVEVESERDTYRDNNRSFVCIRIPRRSQALVVTSSPPQVGAFKQSIAKTSCDVQIVAPPALPATADGLATQDVVILANVPATLLSTAQVAALERFVADGGGLLVLGGDRSFFPGGYAGSVLERLLPLRSKASPQPPRTSLALVLVIDRSESMRGQRITLAQEAARQVIDVLPAAAEFGLVAFEDQSDWLAPLGPVGDKAALRQRVAQLQAEGRTNLYPALAKAFLALHDSAARRRHILLLTDGIAHMADFTGLARQIAADGITLSTVSVGRDTARDVLEQIAHAAGGQHYVCDDPKSLPQVFRLEAASAARQGIREGVFDLKPTAAPELPPWLRGEPPPAILGYDEATLPPGATAWLTVTDGDPLLAHWMRGKGRVTAWGSDVQGPWTTTWNSWDKADHFWRGLLWETARTVAWPEPRERDSCELPSDELRVRDTNTALLKAIAEATGGTYDVQPAKLLASVPPPVRQALPGWRVLVALAAVLLVFDVSLRRRAATTAIPHTPVEPEAW